MRIEALARVAGAIGESLLRQSRGFVMLEAKVLPFETDGERPIDAGIAREVRILTENGIETFESCQGGDGHAFPEPTVRFHGGRSEGFRALAIASQHGLRVAELRRYWDVIDGEPVGPHWEITFSRISGV